MRRTSFKDMLLIAFMALFVMSSCTSYKQVPYLQNSGDFKSEALELHEAKIMPQDMLTITIVNPEDLAASMPYNLTAPTDLSITRSLTSQPALQNYIVSNDGTVNIPSVGDVKIAGLTLSQAEDAIYKRVQSAFVSDAAVTVRFVDFKVSVLGEVNNPGAFVIKNGKVNVLEALALARDLTIYGLRENVKIIREDENGNKSIHEINLNDANILNSPYFYLQQNDVVYVTPNESKAKGSDVGSTTSLWFSATSILVSLTSLMYNILK